jgi:hypothetical protein
MGRLVRKDNWQSILTSEIEKAKNTVFEYGVQDCATWASKVIRTYTDLTWVPSWENKKEALKFHKEKPMEKRISEILGEAPRGNILLTQRGDLVQKDLGLDSAVGICIGNKVVFLYTDGICYYDLADCIYSWRI